MTALIHASLPDRSAPQRFPLTRSVFQGPTAIAIMGGLVMATALTLVFVPALHAAWFRVQRDAAAQADGGGHG